MLNKSTTCHIRNMLNYQQRDCILVGGGGKKGERCDREQINERESETEREREREERKRK